MPDITQLLTVAREGLALLQKRVLLQDYRLLGGMNPEAYGTNLPLKLPVAAVTAILAPPPAETAANAFTSLFDIHAFNAASPEVYTIAVSSPEIAFDTTGNPAGANFDLKARIEWGTGGGRHSADIDMRDGIQLSVLGTQAKVTAIYTAIQTVAGIPSVRGSASIAYGSRGNNGPPTWTGLQRTLAPGATISFTIPPFATDVTVYVIDQTTGLSSGSIIQAGTTAVVNPPGFVTTQPANSNPKYRLPHMVRELFVTNTSGVDNATVTVVFDIGL